MYRNIKKEGLTLKTSSKFIKAIRKAVANMKGPYDENETKETIRFIDNSHTKTQRLLDDLRKGENKK